MAHPPYMNSTGLIPRIFAKIAEAQKPERFTTDFLTNVIGHGSGSARPVIPLLKRLGFLQSDGAPTQIYARFRNRSERSSAMLEALKSGYAELYARSEYAHLLAKEKLRDLVVEVTGLERDSSVVDAIVGTFQALKTVGEISEATKIGGSHVPESATAPIPYAPPTEPARGELDVRRSNQEVGMNLSYTINLNLPPTADPEVFNAIFKALKEHLLTK
jgi:hypothetical protein